MSRAGTALAGFLLCTVAQHPRRAFSGPAGAMELLFQVFVVAVRRDLAREPGTRAVTAHVTEAFARLGTAPDERSVQKGVRLVEAALGRAEWKEGAFARDTGLVSSLLVDLVRTRRMDATEIGMLVAAGEQRIRRLGRARQGRRTWRWWERLPRIPDIAPPPPARRDRGPRSITGHGLKALARYDTQAACALPDDPSPECAHAVIDNAFAVAVRERFGERPDHDHIVLLAESVSRLSRSPAIAASDVESLVLAEFTAPDREEPECAAEIKISTFAKIVDDLGLYDHEIDDLIAVAEGIAEEDGCELSLLHEG